MARIDVITTGLNAVVNGLRFIKGELSQPLPSNKRMDLSRANVYKEFFSLCTWRGHDTFTFSLTSDRVARRSCVDRYSVLDQTHGKTNTRRFDRGDSIQSACEKEE